MDINIIAGKCNELNNEYIFSLLKSRDKSKKHIIVAPDRTLFSLEQRLFDELDESCFFDVNIISLTRLSKQLLHGHNKSNILTKQSGVALVKKILSENKDSLYAFGKAVNFIGFAETLFETICLYKSCNITPKDIFVDDSMSYSNLKQRDIKFIYTKYEEFLQNDYTDSFNQLKLYADLIDANTYKDTVFYFIEFDDFTAIMYDIIYKISKYSEACYITCLYGKENNNNNIYSNKVYYDLIDLFKFYGLNYKINKVKSFEDNVSNVLVDNIFAYEPKEIKSDRFKINSFDNIIDEIKFTIADIYSRVLVSKESFSNFVIVVSNLLEYKSLLIQELKKYNIPYYVDESIVMSEHCIIRLLFDILDILTGDFNVSLFTNILKSPLLNFNNEMILEYDNYLKRIGAESYQIINKNIINDEQVLEFFDLINQLSEELKNIDKLEDYLEGIVIKIYEYIVKRREDYVSKLNTIEVRTINQVDKKFNNINNDFFSVFGKFSSSFEDFILIYKTYFDSTNLTMPPISSNTLFIADFNSSYITKVHKMYIMGCNEGKLPKFKLDNGLVTDEEISKLPNANKINPTINMLNNRKQFKLFDILFKSNDITLSYALSNGEERLYPNNLVSSPCRIMSIDVKNMSYTFDLINKSYFNLDYNNIVFNNLTPNIAKYNLTKNLKYWNSYSNNDNYKRILSSLYIATIDTNSHKIINNLNKKSTYSNLSNVKLFRNNNTSISQVECYNSCPYKHFVSYGLRLRDSITNKLKANDIGTIIHEVLRYLIPYMLENMENKDAIIKKAHDLLTHILNKDEYIDISTKDTNSFVLKSLYRELTRITNALLYQIKNSNFVPKYYEFRFDSKKVKIKDLNLLGSIDRVDVNNNKFVVIDYKTGDNGFNNFNDIYSGKKLQLMIYSWAYMKQSGSKPSGAFYLPISNEFSDDDKSSYKLNGVMLKSEENIIDLDKNLSEPNSVSKTINLRRKTDGSIYPNNCYKFLCLDDDEFEYLLDFSVKQVEKSIQKIILGEITPNPLVDGGYHACNKCNYKGLCNYLEDNDRVITRIESIAKLREKEAENG